jgi:hypothetical protein
MPCNTQAGSNESSNFFIERTGLLSRRHRSVQHELRVALGLSVLLQRGAHDLHVPDVLPARN